MELLAELVVTAGLFGSWILSFPFRLPNTDFDFVCVGGNFVSVRLRVWFSALISGRAVEEPERNKADFGRGNDKLGE